VNPRDCLGDVEKILDPIGTRNPTHLWSSPKPVAMQAHTTRRYKPLLNIYKYINMFRFED
jgi:hypothetical protein